jgi:hypothetical protein
MATSIARVFSVEETKPYVGAFNGPARIFSVLVGVTPVLEEIMISL